MCSTGMCLKGRVIQREVPEAFLRGYLGEPGYGFAAAQVPDLEVDCIRAVAGR